MGEREWVEREKERKRGGRLRDREEERKRGEEREWTDREGY